MAFAATRAPYGTTPSAGCATPASRAPTYGIRSGCSTPTYGQVAVALGEVEPVADHELVRDLEADVAHGHVDLAPLGLRQQGADLERGRLARLQVAHQVRERQPRVDDVLDDEHVPARDVDVEVLEDPHDARGVGRRAVARDRHEVDLARDDELAHQVGHEEDGALEHADEQQVAARVVGRDLRAERRDALLARRPRRSGSRRRPRSTSLTGLLRADDDAVPAGRDGDPGYGDDLVGVRRPPARRPARLSAPSRPRADPAPSCGGLPDDPPAGAPRTSRSRPVGLERPGPPGDRCPRAGACRTRVRRGRRRRGRRPSCRRARRAARRATPRGAAAGAGARSPSASRFASAPGWRRRSRGRISSRISPRAVSRLVASTRTGEAVLAAVGGRLLARDVEQRSHDAVLAAHLDPARRAARDDPVEHGLDLVRGGVAGRAQPRARGRRVAKLAHRRLGRRRLDADDAAPIEVRAVLGVGVGVGAPHAVVDVHGSDVVAERARARARGRSSRRRPRRGT